MSEIPDVCLVRVSVIGKGRAEILLRARRGPNFVRKTSDTELLRHNISKFHDLGGIFLCSVVEPTIHCTGQ